MLDLFQMYEDEKFYLDKFQIYNWGTFSGYHSFNISKLGTVITGQSGSGKSTILDANSALLVPSIKRRYNLASTNDGKKRSDRNDVTYMLGAWSKKSDNNNQEKTQFLRTAPNYSVLAQTYKSGDGRTVTICQLIYLNKKSMAQDDIKRIYLIINRDFSIKEIKHFESVKQLKELLPQANNFRYCDTPTEYFNLLREELGIDSEKALSLLHKAQSAKNLGNIDAFLKDFMIDEPETYDVVRQMSTQFININQTYEHIRSLESQIDLLKEIDSFEKELVNLKLNEKNVTSNRDYRQDYSNLLKREISKRASIQLETDVMSHNAEILSNRETSAKHEQTLIDLNVEYQSEGGSAIAKLKGTQQHIIDSQQGIKTSLGQFKDALKKCDIPSDITDEQSFAEAIASCSKKERELERVSTSLFIDAGHALVELDRLEEQREKVERDLALMKDSNSMIDGRAARIRNEICEHLGLNVDDLPYAAEYLRVKKSEMQWVGSIERLLHSFGLTLLVTNEHFNEVTEFVNAHHLNGILQYDHVESLNYKHASNLHADSVVNKLECKSGALYSYVAARISELFGDYRCFNDISDFKNEAVKGLTKEGLIRQGVRRYRKDDRFNINDRGRWILGWTNEEKMASLQARLHDLKTKIEDARRKKDQAAKSNSLNNQSIVLMQGLAKIKFSDIDLLGACKRADDLAAQINKLENGNDRLKSLSDAIEQITNEKKAIDQLIINLIVERDKLANKKKEAEDLIKEIDNKADIVIPNEVQAALSELYSVNTDKATLSVVLQKDEEVKDSILESLKTISTSIGKVEASIQQCLERFVNRFPEVEAEQGLKSDLDELIHFLNYYERITNEDIVRFKKKFEHLLNDTLVNHVTGLRNKLAWARQTIETRLEETNEALSTVDYNNGRYLKIDFNTIANQDATQCKSMLKRVTEDLADISDAGKTRRFNEIKVFIDRFNSSEPADKTFIQNALDIRKQISFYAKEIDPEKPDVNGPIHGTDGELSGGQKEKLTATVMAAALRYHLTGDNRKIPTFAPIVLDEAFIRTDANFTNTVLNVYKKMGFQLIIGTPNKSLTVIEPFVDNAISIGIEQEKYSYMRDLEIGYDDQERFYMKQGEILTDD
ncbi:ATP-binding protein [Vibrio fluvialis]|uniref:ATP-binding protein n=1 Tax=Vibrio fluvialis TaxID=676 RepID=UPI002ACB0248|nr:ATP-binding protein [Vibrio fluvialis]MDZ5515760.1 ATP-binding protein [Vibrio fluvialis]